jgi:hypothetical protein
MINFRQSETSEVIEILGIFAKAVSCLLVGVAVLIAFDTLLMYGIKEIVHLASKLPPL